MTGNTLDTPAVRSTLDQLHAAAKADWQTMVKSTPKVLAGLAQGKGMMQALTPDMAKDAYMEVSAEDGRMLNVLLRSLGAKHIVEFGTSFGVGTIYLAAAAKDNGGHVITSELEPNKCRAARQNLAQAGLADVTTVSEGDALATLANVSPDVDVLFLDGWKDLYSKVLDLMLPKLRPGAVVIADNITLAEAKELYARVNEPGSGFVTSKLGKDTSLSYYLGKDA